MHFFLSSKPGDALDLTAEDKFRYTPLHHLLNSKLDGPAVDFFFAMLSNGSDPNAQDKHGFTPLHLLCNNKEARRKGLGKEMVKMALEMGGEPSMQANDGCTPLHLALYHKDYEVRIARYFRASREAAS